MALLAPAAMAHPIDVQEHPHCLVVHAPTPGRMRATAIAAAGLALLFALFNIDVWIMLVRSEGDWMGALLFDSLGTWWVLGLIGLFVALLVLDGRTLRRTVWTADVVRVSTRSGPFELFPFIYRQAELPPLEVREDAANAVSFIHGRIGAWQLGWREPDPAGKRAPGFRELARFDSQEEALALCRRLLTWSPRAAAAGAAPESALDTAATSIASLLLRMPLVAVLGLSLAMIGVAGESLALRMGKAPVGASPLWTGSAEAELVRFAFRVDLRPRETRTSQGVEWVDQPHSELQVAVRFVDSRGRVRERPLVPLRRNKDGLGPMLSNHDGGPHAIAVALAQVGWIPPRLDFELPSEVLALPRLADGALDFRRAQTDPAAQALSREYQRHWGVLASLDSPDSYLPLYWSAPGLRSPLRIVYHEADADDRPVWLLAEAETHALDLADFGGMVYVLALPAILFGGFVFFVLMPLRADWLKAVAWLLIVASAAWWGPRVPGVPDWLDIDRGLQSRVRAQIGNLWLPDPRPLLAIDERVIVGHWTPQVSRYAPLLAALDLLQPPAERPLGVQAAREAIAARARQRLAGMQDDAREQLLGDFPARQLLLEGNDWLVREVIAPGMCPWFSGPDADTGLSARYRRIGQALECGSSG